MIYTLLTWSKGWLYHVHKTNIISPHFRKRYEPDLLNIWSWINLPEYSAHCQLLRCNHSCLFSGILLPILLYRASQKNCSTTKVDDLFLKLIIRTKILVYYKFASLIIYIEYFQIKLVSICFLTSHFCFTYTNSDGWSILGLLSTWTNFHLKHFWWNKYLRIQCRLFYGQHDLSTHILGLLCHCDNCYLMEHWGRV